MVKLVFNNFFFCSEFFIDLSYRNFEKFKEEESEYTSRGINGVGNRDKNTSLQEEGGWIEGFNKTFTRRPNIFS